MPTAPGAGAGFAGLRGLSVVGAGEPWAKTGAGAQEALVRRVPAVPAAGPGPRQAGRLRSPRPFSRRKGEREPLWLLRVGTAPGMPGAWHVVGLACRLTCAFALCLERELPFG